MATLARPEAVPPENRFISSMQTAKWLAFGAGVALAIGLIAWTGAGEVADATAAIGWGFLGIVFFRAVPVALMAAAWRVLLGAADERAPLGELLLLRWIADAVNGLLPTAQVGGEVVRARLLARRTGVRMVAAAASVAADQVAALLGLAVFVASGVAIIAWLKLHDGLRWSLGIAVLVLLLFAGAIVVALRLGAGGRIAAAIDRRLLADEELRLSRALAGFEQLTQDIIASGRALAGASFWRLAAWASGAVVVWLAAHFIGVPVSWLGAVAIEAGVQAARTIGFAVPGAVGLQEGAFLLGGAALGLPAEAALAFALVKRGREIATGLPALFLWPFLERRAAATPGA
jgi:putative membrane protein